MTGWPGLESSPVFPRESEQESGITPSVSLLLKWMLCGIVRRRSSSICRRYLSTDEEVPMRLHNH